MQAPIQETVQKAAAGATVATGSWLSLEAITQGLNIVVASLGIVAAILAIMWWRVKLRREREGLHRDRRDDPGGTEAE